MGLKQESVVLTKKEYVGVPYVFEWSAYTCSANKLLLSKCKILGPRA